MTFHSLEHRILKNLRSLPGFDRLPFFLQVSGGLDSMCLLSVFANLRVYLKNEIHVVHFHHGFCLDDQQFAFRNEAALLVQECAKEYRFPCSVFKSDERLSTESQYRSFRRKHLQAFEGVLVTGHQGGDVLETYLLKMIRGGGVNSLSAFKEWNGRTYRPFLSIPKKSLYSYAKQKGVRFFEDPSNRQNSHLRNWLRNVWLPDLENKIAGGVSALGNSIDCLIQQSSGQEVETSAFVVGNVFLRTHYDKLHRDEGRTFLHRFLKTLFPGDYFSRGHVEEVQKHLDKPQKLHIFRIGAFEWSVNAEQIQVRKLDQMVIS